jgi:photosystem II cytochrome c550
MRGTTLQHSHFHPLFTMLPLSRLLVLLCLLTTQWLLWTLPADAAIDAYVARYLKVTDTVDLPQDTEGHRQTFSAADLSAGKQLFETNCLSCHVGGITLLEPDVSLSLADLQAASPRRDSIAGLVNFFRQPLTYDGRDNAISCREIPESWLPNSEVEKLAAFMLRSAEIAPGWGTAKF